MPDPRRDSPPVQREMPLATLHGEPVVDLPEDLYIPPEALEVYLDAFEGPLDLLLYLIRRQNLDILDLPLVEITDQYLRHISLMEELQLELASEYLVMAAMLAEIKSRMLLPAPEVEGEEEDPRAELVRRLQEYERFKVAAESLNNLPRLERDVFEFALDTRDLSVPRPLPKVGMQDLLMALEAMLLRAQYNVAHQIETESLSVQDRMSEILDRVGSNENCLFTSLFTAQEGRQGMAVSLLAILELLKLGMVDCRQEEYGGPIIIFRCLHGAGEESAHA
ncbi:MAG: segregation/condensation protein A [Gammaproteobacteria bacterium]|nr:segregation/condensation protein A [Gammaproteobacteria bacterium]